MQLNRTNHKLEAGYFIVILKVSLNKPKENKIKIPHGVEYPDDCEKAGNQVQSQRPTTGSFTLPPLVIPLSGPEERQSFKASF